VGGIIPASHCQYVEVGMQEASRVHRARSRTRRLRQHACCESRICWSV